MTDADLGPSDAALDGVAGGAGTLVAESGGQGGNAGRDAFAESVTDAVPNADQDNGHDATVEATIDATVDGTDGRSDADAPDALAEAATTDASDAGAGDATTVGMLLRGTIGTTAPILSSAGNVRLVSLGFSAPGARICNGTMCLRSGGVLP